MDICNFEYWGTDSVCTQCHADPLTCAHDSVFHMNTRNFLIVTMNITDRCNESCDHCWHKVMLDTLGETRRDLNKEDIDLLWDYLDNSMFKDYSIIYSFIGGEPTLRPDIMDYALQKSLDSRGRVSCRIYTNAVTGLDEIKFLKMKHRNVKLQVSLPVNSNKRILEKRNENIKKYIQMQNFIDITFSIVIDEGNIDDMINIIDQCKADGMHEMSMTFDLRHREIKDPEALFEKLVKLFRHCKSIMDETFSVVEIEGGAPETVFAAFNPNNIIVNYDSSRNLYLTHFVKSEPIGDVYDGIDFKKVRDVYTNSPCLKCEHMKLCNVRFIPAFINDDLSTTAYDATCICNRALFTVLREE